MEHRRRGGRTFQRGQRQRGDDQLIRIVDVILYNTAAIKKAIGEARQDRGIRSAPVSDVRTGFCSPTEKEAISNLTELVSVALDDGNVIKFPERWMKIVDTVYERAGRIEREVLRRRYWRGEHYAKIIQCLNISQQHYYFILNRLRERVLCAACQYGLLRVI